MFRSDNDVLTPEPDGGFYKDADVAAFIRKFGYADKNDKPTG